MAEKTGSHSYMGSNYLSYQAQYRKNPRESDKTLVSLITERLDASSAPPSVCDMGCHQGNFLHHLRAIRPHWSFHGRDMFEHVIEAARREPDLEGVSFEPANLLTWNEDRSFSCVVTNAVVSRFDDQELLTAFSNIAKHLDPGGYYFGYEWVHVFHQTLRIIEETPTHPAGLTIVMRSERSMRELLAQAGFDAVEFYPFEIPIDLPQRDPTDALYTHTKTLTSGKRLMFRGSLFQPWCHFVARISR